MLTQIDDITMVAHAPRGMGVGPSREGAVALLAEPPEASCFDADPNLFFAEAPSDIESAKAICGSCLSRHLCLAGALRRREPHGVWGGELFQNGQVIGRKRPRGRPRKHPVEAPLVAVTPADPAAAGSEAA